MTDKPTIVEALAAAMGEVRAVGKDDFNSQQRYNFRGVDAVVNACAPVLRKHGVIVAPMMESSSWRDVKTSTGKDSREVTVTVRYRFYGPAGDYIDAIVPGESMDFGDKGAPKAMSVAFRTALIQTLCLPTHDVDPDSESYERGSARSSDRESHQAASGYDDDPNGRPPVSNGEAHVSPARRANDLVKILVTVDTNERAEVGLQRAEVSPGVDINVVPLLTPPQKEAVGIAAGDVITLKQFAAMVADFVKEHGKAVSPVVEAAKA